MNLSKVRSGDIVECDVRGYHFLARYVGTADYGRVQVEPLNRNVTFYRPMKQELRRKLKPAEVETWEMPGGEVVRSQFKPRRPRLAQ